MNDTFTSISDLYEYVTPELPGCPLSVIRQKAYWAIKRFLEETQSYIYESVPVKIRTGITDYEFSEYPGEYMPDRIFDVKRFNSDHTQYSILDCNSDYLALSPSAIRLSLSPVEDTVGGLVARLILVPSSCVTQIPTEIYRRCQNAICSGIKFLCFSMAKTPWADMQMAIYYNGSFEELIAKERIFQARGGLNRTIILKPGERFA